MHGSPIADISSIIHVTGNPVRKIQEWLKNDDVKVEIHLENTDIETPPIIVMLQVANDIPDSKALSMWNMGIPKVVTVNAKDVEKVLQAADEEGIEASIIGKVSQKWEWEKSFISGVGVGKSKIEL